MIGSELETQKEGMKVVKGMCLCLWKQIISISPIRKIKLIPSTTHPSPHYSHTSIEHF